MAKRRMPFDLGFPPLDGGDHRFASQGLGKPNQPALDLIADESFLAAAYRKLDRAVHFAEAGTLQNRRYAT